MYPWRSTDWLPRLEVVDWTALRDCQVTHAAATLRLEGLDPERAPMMYADAEAEVRAIVEVAIIALDRVEGQDALTAAECRVPPLDPHALDRDRHRLRRLLDVTLAPSIEYLGKRVPAALAEVYEATDAEAVTA